MNQAQISNLIETMVQVAATYFATKNAAAGDLIKAAGVFAVAVVAFLYSHVRQGGSLPTGKQLSLFALCFFIAFGSTACTSFVKATGQNKVITSISTRVFGVNIAPYSAASQSPTIQLGLVTTTVQFMPTATNNAGILCAPDYASTFSLENNASPFTFDGDETFASGHDATYGATNGVQIAPVVPGPK